MEYSFHLEGASAMITFILCIGIIVINYMALWKMFEKAGIDGWKSLIPFYNSYCICELAMGNGLLFLLSFIPCINFIFSIILCLNLAKAYGKDTLFGILMIFFGPIMYLILAFSDAEYVGPQK